MEASPFTDMTQVASNVEDTFLIEWIKDNPDWFEFPFLSNSFNMAATITAHSSLLRSQLLACHAMLPVWHTKRKLRRRLCSLMLSLLWCSRWLMFLSSVHQYQGQCFVLLSLIISSKKFCVSTQPVTTNWDGLFQKIPLCHKQGAQPKKRREPKTNKWPVACNGASLISNSVGFGFA